MPKSHSFTNEQDVEEEAIDLIASLGYTDLRSAEYNRPNIQVDSERDNDHQKVLLDNGCPQTNKSWSAELCLSRSNASV